MIVPLSLVIARDLYTEISQQSLVAGWRIHGDDSYANENERTDGKVFPSPSVQVMVAKILSVDDRPRRFHFIGDAGFELFEVLVEEARQIARFLVIG